MYFLEQTLEDCKKEIADNILNRGLNATGETIRTMEVVMDGPLHGTLYGRKYFDNLEHGTAPNGRVDVSRSFHDAIANWITAKGLTLNPWAVALKIQQEGTRTWRKGGRKDIYTDAVKKAVEKIESEDAYESLLKEIETIR